LPTPSASTSSEEEETVTLRERLSAVPRPTLYLLATGAAVILLLLLWYQGGRLWNGVGNYFFRREMNQARAEVQKQLDEAAAQKKELEHTLIQLDGAKKDLAAAETARAEMERVFNDKFKTAGEKVAAFRDSLSDAPVHTDTTGITTSALCERAKANNASPGTIAALCAQ
jgi:hypothetical protein